MPKKYNKTHNYLPFEQALLWARENAIRNGVDRRNKWGEYVRSGSKPSNIPVSPWLTYKNLGWVSFGHWFGTGNLQGGQRKHAVNESFFKTWSHEMAYIFGFWFADGNIHYGKSGYRFRITQHENDKYILLKILNKIGAEGYPLSKKDKCFNISINSEEIYNDIISLGGKEKKSLDIDFPVIPDEFAPDFIRGYFDGDGCIFKRGRSYCSNFVCGSLSFIKGLYNCLNQRLENFKGIVREIPGGYKMLYGVPCLFGKTYRLSMESHDTRKLGDFIYGDCDGELRIERKRQKFLLVRKPRCEYSKKIGVKYGLDRID